MFKRRKQQPVHHKVGNLIWPRIGFRRSITYIWHRIGRLHGTPHSIAGGFAAGAAISFTPFVGGHLVLAALLSWATRSNIVAGLIGTAVGNPWTFPFIWVWIYEIGHQMGAGRELGSNPDFVAIFTDLPGVFVRAVISFDLDSTYFDNVWTVLWPMIVGSIPTVAVVWLVSYFMLKPIIATYQSKRAARRQRKHDKYRTAGAELPEEADELDMPLSDDGEMAKEARG
jgi:uncharacterized protein (DUF2062 family)